MKNFDVSTVSHITCRTVQKLMPCPANAPCPDAGAPCAKANASIQFLATCAAVLFFVVATAVVVIVVVVVIVDDAHVSHITCRTS